MKEYPLRRSFPGVRYPDIDHIGQVAQFDPHGSSDRSEFNRIVDEILNHPVDQRNIRDD